MTTDTLTVDLNMPHRAVKAIPSGALRLVCREGSVWITLDHDQQDVILNAGDTFVTQAHHRVIAYALQTAVLRLEPLPCTRRATASRWRWLPRRRARGLAAA